MPVPANPSFDVRQIPFSIRGSWLDISPVVALHTTREDLHLVTHQTGMHAVVRLIPQRAGERVALENRASPSRLEWLDAGRPVIEAAFEGVDIVRLRGTGIELRIVDAAEELTPFTGTYLFRDPVDGAAVFTSYETGRRYRVTAIRGELVIEGSEALGQGERSVLARGSETDGGGWELAIEEFEAARHPYRSEADFDQVVAASALAFAAFADEIAGWRGERFPAAELAAYVLWSATVAPKGFLRRESVLMSKHWMDKVWSWDHCFNALALVEGDAGLALDQFLTPFDHQDASGGLPDSVTHSEVLYNFVKPPIHGWTLAQLRAQSPLDATVLADVYAKLSRSTRFWLDFRRVPGHVLPHYQHGNDSGWDNSTTFDRDRVIEAPDLAAFLLVQLEELATIADQLVLGDATEWRGEAAAISTALLAELWDGESFVAHGAAGGRVSKTGSLLNLLPIVAAELLPREVTDRLADDIARHLTEFGPATQLLDSEEYDDDGYWRGPIWAPSTVLIEDGLRRAGRTELADEISARFLALCERSGFAENFDARTGVGLRDRAYTWTASAYLVLARQAAERGR
ncbi:amylo-alpha-1,6-glucosidase [Lysinimonas soli]|uniref:Amylo-alpha-1,6-glucosidase n=1 Tax=Lysinimonas soli TaxID=1074233 RepID=A0ABW0NR78_9MICO